MEQKTFFWIKRMGRRLSIWKGEKHMGVGYICRA